MRRRSGAFHCQSIEEFIQTYEASVSNDHPPQKPFSDIQTYLLHNQHLHNTQSNNQQEYFFSQIDQMRSQEENELSLGSRHRNIVNNNVALISQQLPLLYDYLLNQSHISNTYTSLYQDSLPQHQEIEVNVNNHIVNVMAKPTKFTDEISSEKGERIKDLLVGDGKEEKKQETQRYRSVWERVNRSELQLIVYYNRVQINSLQVGKQNHNLGELAPVVQVQTKFWLIRQKEAYSPLLQAYLNQCQHIFIARIQGEKLQLNKIDKGNPQLGGNPQKEEKSQDYQGTKVQTWTQVLSRVSAPCMDHN